MKRIWFFEKGTVDCTSNPFHADLSSKKEVINAMIKLLEGGIANSTDAIYVYSVEKIDWGIKKEAYEEYDKENEFCRAYELSKSETINLLKRCVDKCDKIWGILVYVSEWMNTGLGDNCSDKLEMENDGVLILNMQDWYETEDYRKVVGAAEKVLGISFDGDYEGHK